MNLYPFIAAEKSNEDGNVSKACAVLGVSSSAFYASLNPVPCARQIANIELLAKITRIYDASKGTYGWPRVHAQLRRDGTRVGRRRVARLMRTNGMAGRCKRRWKATTIADPQAQAVADLVKRSFGPGSIDVNRVWVSDITYIWTWEGWMYLASVIDLSSRKIVGWALADHMRTGLVLDALTMAVDRRNPPPGLIFHSDRGTQYTSTQLREALQANGMVQSMSRKGQCWDNAVAEAWFGTLKRELIGTRSWATHAQVRTAVFEWVEVTYNNRRLHSSLEYQTPTEYDNHLQSINQSARAA